MTEEKHELC